MAEDCREHGANHGIIGVRTEPGSIDDPSGLRCLFIVFGFEFTIGIPNREKSWLVCVGLRRLSSRSESWELIPYGGHPRAIMTEAVPSTRLARLPDRQVDYDNSDGGSGCHRRHHHSQFTVPHSLRQSPAGPHRHGPAGATCFLWHALWVDHETRYRLWPAHPATEHWPSVRWGTIRCPWNTRSHGRRRDRHAAKSDLLTEDRSRTRQIGELSIDMQGITITKTYPKFQGQLSFGVRYV